MVFSICFPASAQVQTGTGASRPIGSLKPYEELRTLGLNKNGKSIKGVKGSPFYTYLHFEPEATSEFLVFHCENNLELIISEAHLLFKRDSDGTIAKATMAKNIRIGDSLLHVGSDKVIQSVGVTGIDKRVCIGVFAPLTKSGTLMVNGFLVSSYAHVDSHAKAHASLAPLRLWYGLGSKIGKNGPTAETSKGPKTGIHAYAKTLASVYGLSY
jgi:hypothetical protein